MGFRGAGLWNNTIRFFTNNTAQLFNHKIDDVITEKYQEQRKEYEIFILYSEFEIYDEMI